jgi:hypothetical protein
MGITYDNELHIVLSSLQPSFRIKLTSRILQFHVRSYEWFGSMFGYSCRDDDNLDIIC